MDRRPKPVPANVPPKSVTVGANGLHGRIGEGSPSSALGKAGEKEKDARPTRFTTIGRDACVRYNRVIPRMGPLAGVRMTGSVVSCFSNPTKPKHRHDTQNPCHAFNFSLKPPEMPAPRLPIHYRPVRPMQTFSTQLTTRNTISFKNRHSGMVADATMPRFTC